MSAPAISVLGGGAWGTALAQMLAREGTDTLLWARDPATVQEVAEARTNARYLPGVSLDPRLAATGDLGRALVAKEAVLIATPTQTLRDLAGLIGSRVAGDAPLVLCAKGIERGTGQFPTGVMIACLPQASLAVLSGPSFAADVARGLPTAVTVAARNEALAARLAARLSGRGFRCYSSDDVAGVEAGAALKNVLALAAGAANGAGLGASAQAALVTRGFVELRRLGAAFGARPETMMGLSGLGDLMLTCNSMQSRNFSYGVALGRGDSLDGMPLAEGVATAAIATRLAADLSVDAPIIDAVDRLLSRSLTIREAVEQLLARPLKHETQ